MHKRSNLRDLRGYHERVSGDSAVEGLAHLKYGESSYDRTTEHLAR
jgi:hypothetical protein